MFISRAKYKELLRVNERLDKLESALSDHTDEVYFWENQVMKSLDDRIEQAINGRIRVHVVDNLEAYEKGIKAKKALETLKGL